MRPPAIGDRLPGAVLGPFGPSDIARYAEASGDCNPIHVDPVAAAGAGLAGPIVQGMLVMAHMVRIAERWREDAALMTVRSLFVRPVGLNETLVVDGRIMACEGDAQTWQCTLRLTARSKVSPIAAIVEARMADIRSASTGS